MQKSVQTPEPHKLIPFQLSVIFFVAANSVPVIGVLFFGWNLFQILFLYWIESGIIGFYAMLRMFRSHLLFGALFSILFLMHFSIFMSLHLAFLVRFYGPYYGSQTFFPPLTILLPAFFSVKTGIISIFLNHGASFVGDPFVRSDDLIRQMERQMVAPYGRIVLMHLTLILGSFAVSIFRQPILGLVFLIGLKTSVDFFFLWREDR